MRRGLILSLGLGLLGAIAGCNGHCHGICDCQVHPIDHCTPSPIAKPATPVGEPIRPVADVHGVEAAP